MKKIEAILRREKLREVMNALEQAHCPGIMICDIEGYGKQKGITEQFRGREVQVNLVPKVKLELVLPSAKVPEFVSIIQKVAKTGAVGDGKIFIYEIAEAIKIRTGESGEEVVS